MITVLPGKSFEFKNPVNKAEIDRIKSAIIQSINNAAPFLEGITFVNNTKYCTVEVAFKDKQIFVMFRNPKDAEFDLNDLNEMENPITPIQITGR